MGQFLESIGNTIPSFVGIKFTSANLEEGAQALHADNKKYVIFLGNDQVGLNYEFILYYYIITNYFVYVSDNECWVCTGNEFFYSN